jgi:hypothetical protein
MELRTVNEVLHRRQDEVAQEALTRHSTAEAFVQEEPGIAFLLRDVLQEEEAGSHDDVGFGSLHLVEDQRNLLGPVPEIAMNVDRHIRATLTRQRVKSVAGAAIAQVHLVSHGMNAREALSDLQRPVTAAIVHDQDLVLGTRERDAAADLRDRVRAIEGRNEDAGLHEA